MFDNTKNNGSGCFSEEELVSYLYGEIAESHRLKIDSHLAHCSLCADEFAGVSGSRFSVYEWQRSSFAPLETPEITGPWQQPIRRGAVATGTSTRSWLTALLARPAFAFTAIPVLLALGLIGVFYSNFTTRKVLVSEPNDQVSTLQASPPVQSTPATQPTQSDIARGSDARKVAVTSPVIAKNKVVSQYARVVNRRPLQSRLKTEMESTDRVKDSSVLHGRSPRLGDYEEDEDTSVRLTDLLADTDTDR